MPSWRPLPGLVEDPQQQLLGGEVLADVARVQVDEGALEVGRHLGEGAQLDEVEEVEVLQPTRALTLGLRGVKAPTELLHVGAPQLLPPPLCLQSREREKLHKEDKTD